jgi:hypothetical protein
MLQTALPRERLERSWYDLVAEQLQALTHTFGIEQTSVHLYQAYELICKDFFALHPGAPATRTSTLHHDGTPVQFMLTFGRPDLPKQSLRAAGDAGRSRTGRIEVIEKRLRKLSSMLQLKVDVDSIAALINRTAAMHARSASPDRGGTFWIGASFANEGKAGLKIYINGRSGAENERWARVENFAEYFCAFENQQELRQLLAGKMTPLGMAISLTQDESPAGRVYLSGYGNCVSYYEDLLRHCSGVQYLNVFRRYTEAMLEEDNDSSQQSVVFSVGLRRNREGRTDVKVEFCGHCLFQSDRQAREHCLRWLALQKLDARAYVELLEAIAGQMSPPDISKLIYSGLGSKQPQEPTGIYMTPHAACKTTAPEQ